MHTKTLGPVTVKDAATGEVEAAFSTFGVIDKDGDVLKAESFTDGAPVIISQYNHGSWAPGGVPVGRGKIVVEDDRAVLKGRFFLNTTAGRDTFETVKALSEAEAGAPLGLQEWSYSLHNVKSERTTVNGVRANLITQVDVAEVSPVIIGAGVETHTLLAKIAAGEPLKESAALTASSLRAAGKERWGADTTWVWLDDWDPDAGTAVFTVEPEGEAPRLVQVSFSGAGSDVELGDDEIDVVRVTTYAPKTGGRFIEHARAVLAAVEALTERSADVVALRASKGRGLAPASSELLDRVVVATGKLAALLEPTSDDAGTAPAGEQLTIDQEAELILLGAL